MHFVTESELRTTYQKEPFTEFCLTKKERLTPGAKQFILDNKIQMVSEAELNKKTAELKLTTLAGYKEIVSSELLEVALLAMEHQLRLSQQLMDLEKTLMSALQEDKTNDDFMLATSEAFQLDAVHIFSKQGVLLIKLKKVYGMLHLIQAEYPQYSEPLINASQQINKLKKQLIGETNGKTIDEEM